MTRSLAILALVAFALVQPAHAQFTVFDPSVHAQAIIIARQTFDQIERLDALLTEMERLADIGRYGGTPPIVDDGSRARYLDRLSLILPDFGEHGMDPEMAAWYEEGLGRIAHSDEVRAAVAAVLGRDTTLRTHFDRLLTELEFDVTQERSLASTLSTVAASGLVAAEQSAARDALLRAQVELDLDTLTRAREQDAFEMQRRFSTFRHLTSEIVGPVY